MSKTILLTSFTTWKPEQTSNSSDDLLLEIAQSNPPASLHFLRQLPVDFELAPQKAIAHVNQLQPDVVLCCGMAETRDRLNLEAQAVREETVLKTGIPLESLMTRLSFTEISFDAGKFVCNALYYALLEHLQTQDTHCLFVHIPVLTPDNRPAVLADFRQILHGLQYS